MKLVDILARELKEWPEGSEYCEQDHDREVRFRDSVRYDFFAEQLADRDPKNAASDGIPHSGKVTRAQWKAAVDALKAGEQLSKDEGLPPIGSVIRIDSTGKTVWDVAEQFIGVDVTLVAIFQTGNTLMVAVELESTGQCCCFRADMVRTAEQIAAEEREKAIMAMVDDSGFEVETDNIWPAMEALHNAGYRKQVQP